MNQARKRTGTKKVLSMILVLVMLLSLLSMAAFTLPTAASSDSAASNDDSFYRIVHLDCGRKYFSKDWIIALLNEMKADGYNQLQLAFGNDGLRFLLDDMSFTANGTTYSHKTVVSKVEAGNEAQNSSGDKSWLTQSQMDDIISAAKGLGIEIVPLLNLPGHANAILDIANDTYNASGSNNTLDVANSEAARSFGMAIFQKYVDYFAGKGCKFFNFGADEYANDASGTFSFSRLNSTQYATFVSFINSLSTYVKSKGMTPRAFNDGLYYNGQSASIDTKIQCCYWSSGWGTYPVAPAETIANKGHDMINTNGDYYYVLGKADKFDSDYNYASKFSNTAFMGSTVNSPVGSMFCIWCDYPNAENEQTVAQKVRLPMRAMALRMENQSIANMDESVVTNGFNANGSLNAGSTVTPDTNTSTKDIYVAVNGTATETVSGTYSGPYTTGDTSIATVTTNATTTEKELKAVTSIESGNQYLIVNNDANKALSDTTATTTFWSWFVDHNVSGLALSGSVSAENTTDLWTIESVGTKYQIKNASGQYLTFGEYSASVGATDSELSLSYSGGSWTIKNGKSYLSRYDATTNDVSAGYNSSSTSNNWTIYEITGGEKTTAITFNGHSVGDTSVKIGDVTYQIHVTKEQLPANALTADTITLEHWITNGRVAQQSGTSGDDINVQTISNTIDNVQTDDGVALDTLSFNPGYWNKDTKVFFWKGVCLDSGHKQQAIDGCDMTTNGTDITHIRYLDGAWQYKTMGGEWRYFLTTDQFVIYYLQRTEVTAEVDTYVKDWGYGTNGTTPNTSSQKGQVALTVAVVYPDGTVSPAEGAMYANSTTIFNYWENRDIGIIAPKNNSDYNISKITVTDGTRDKNTSDLVWYKSDTITWDKKTTAAGGKWYNEQEVWNKSSGTTPMVNGKASNITWSEKNTAKLVLIYLEPVVKNTNLNIVYWDDTANKQINPNPIQIAMTFISDTEPTYTTALRDAKGNVIGGKGSWNSNEVGNANYLPDDAYVVNSSNVHQTISKDMTQIEGIAGNYTSGLYEYRSADISTDGKTLTLHYGLKNTGTKTYVVDFGLPVTIPLSDLGITNLNTISWISLKQETQECLSDHGTYGTAVIDKANKTVTYTLDQTLDNEIAIPINIKFSNNDQIYSYSFHVIPATSVYYEDSFATFTNGAGKAADAKWSIVGNNGNVTEDKSTSKNQALTELGKMDADAVYGYDAAYADSTKLSMGSAHKVTVNANMVNDWTDDSAWPTATFTFKGTGFDIISLTDNNSGAIFVDVYAGKDTTGTPVKQLTVNNYYGYKQDGNGKWVVDTESSNALYQIPVMKVSGLDYGEYTAVIRAAYSKFFDTAKKNQYSFWLDAIRVYDPMGKDNATYTQDGEGYPQYIKLHDALVAENVKNTLFIDGAAEANIATYKNYGPNNEVYLSNGQAITFTVPSDANIASIQIGAKAPDGSAAKMNVNGTETNISSATEMYYKIGTEGRNFTIANNGNGILSLTNLKITFKASGNTVTLSAPTAEEQTAAVMSVRALFAAPEQTFEPEHFTAKWSRNVRKGGTATLTVKASADVEAITVNGEEITVYTTKTARSFWGSKETYHVFTYRVMNAATADYSVCAVNADGAVSDPITATLTVRPSIRDWWNGIFDKWKH